MFFCCLRARTIFSLSKSKVGWEAKSQMATAEEVKEPLLSKF